MAKLISFFKSRLMLVGGGKTVFVPTSFFLMEDAVSKILMEDAASKIGLEN